MNTLYSHNRTTIVLNKASRERDALGAKQRSTPAFVRRHLSVQAAIRCIALLALPLVAVVPRALAKEILTVEGIVETVNDTLNEPYAKSFTTHFSPGQSAAVLRFDIPDGRRLIVESIMIRVRAPSGQKALVGMHAPMGAATAYLSVQSQGVVAGSEHLVGTHPVQLRVNSVGNGEAQADFAFSMERSGDAGAGEFQVAVYGYLVPLPL